MYPFFYPRSTRLLTYLFLFRIYRNFFELIAIDLAAAHCAEDAVAKPLIVALKLGKQLLHLASFRVVILGTGIVEHGKIGMAHEILDILLLSIHQGANDIELRSCEIGNGLKSSKPPFKEEIHHKGVHHIIEMVTESKTVGAHLLGGGM